VKLGFGGSRSLKGEEVKDIIADVIEKYKPGVIVTCGEPEGVCEEVRRYCRYSRKGLTLLLYHLPIEDKATGAYHYRNKAVIEASDRLVFIHDGSSRGTQNEIELAEEAGREYDYFRLDAAAENDFSVPEVEIELDENRLA